MITLTETFGERLNELRGKRNLTVQQLANRASVPATLISGLQTNNRRIGENNARKIGKALQLTGAELESFVYQAINTSEERVLESSKGYPAEVLNLLANELRQSGIEPEKVIRCVLRPRFGDGSSDVAVFLNDGRKTFIEVTLKTE